MKKVGLLLFLVGLLMDGRTESRLPGVPVIDLMWEAIEVLGKVVKGVENCIVDFSLVRETTTEVY